MSVHTWGEDPSGIWQMRINDRVNFLICYFNVVIFKMSNKKNRVTVKIVVNLKTLNLCYMVINSENSLKNKFQKLKII